MLQHYGLSVAELNTPVASRTTDTQLMTLPRIGMLATVRNRRGVISAVEPFAASRTSAVLHLVTIEC